MIFPSTSIELFSESALVVSEVNGPLKSCLRSQLVVFLQFLNGPIFDIIFVTSIEYMLPLSLTEFS